jgi:chromate transport protein ChrA
MLALLCLVYPPRPELAPERGLISHWVAIYVGMALIMTAIGASLSLLADSLLQTPWFKGLVVALLTLVTLALYALVIDRMTAQALESLPFQALHAQFFRYFRSIKFVFIVAPCAALLTLILTLRRKPDRT